MKRLTDFINEEKEISESYALTSAIIGAAAAEGAEHSDGNSSAYNRYYSNIDKHSTSTKVINALMKTVFAVGGGVLLSLTPAAAIIAGVVCLLIAISGDFKEIIDKIASSEKKLNENQEVIEEGKIKDWFISKVTKYALKNEKLKNICNEIINDPKYDEVKKSKSLKKLIEFVVDYFKNNEDKVKDAESIAKNLK